MNCHLVGIRAFACDEHLLLVKPYLYLKKASYNHFNSFTNERDLDLSKYKAFSDNKLKVAYMIIGL